VIKELISNNEFHGDAMTVNLKTMAENTADATCYNKDVIYPFSDPLQKNAGIAVLKGNLAENGAVIKPSAASSNFYRIISHIQAPKLLKHKGRAVVFENIEEFKAKINDTNLDVDENSVLVLKGTFFVSYCFSLCLGAGPKGYPGISIFDHHWIHCR
jgi:L-arabonate dehydrase